jgi:hypothetical protein
VKAGSNDHLEKEERVKESSECLSTGAVYPSCSLQPRQFPFPSLRLFEPSCASSALSSDRTDGTWDCH